ncbi:MAG: glycosyltransferase family 4 protein [Janthinobacterium sp.]
MRIVHLTSAHPRNDTRIFIKECRSLAAAGHDVSLVVADGKGDELRDGVRIVDAGKLSGRLNRMLRTTRRVYDKAVALDAEVYHFHDPELIPAGLKLKRLGKKVVFDSHEDVPQQILAKPYLVPSLLRALSWGFSSYQEYAVRRFDGVVAATPFIRDKFLRIHPNTVDVNNFPLLGEFESVLPWEKKSAEVCYVGGIGAIRGIRELVRACELLSSPARLNVAGSFSEAALEGEVRAYPGWTRVNECGYLGREGVRDVMARSLAGLVTLHPVANYLDALPVKMFEYMAAGIPVIASDFPLWRGIIDDADCGICVDPLDPAAIAAAIDYLVGHPEIARKQGQNGRAAVLGKYNWPAQEAKLINFYRAMSNEK